MILYDTIYIFDVVKTFIIFILWVFPEFAVGAFTLFYCKIALLATVFPKLSQKHLNFDNLHWK